MMQSKRHKFPSTSPGDRAVDGLLQGLMAGGIMLVFLLVIGVVEGAAPTAVLTRFGLPGSSSAVTGLLSHLAAAAVAGLVWGVLYGSLLRRTRLPAWLLGAGYGLALYVSATIFVIGATGMADFTSWALLAAHLLYGTTLGLLSRSTV